ncbi:MAG: methyltransferase domain-containing protein [Candidatus Hydrogenedentes bacterium]|nr:methyltransferase domain-containing protein [Candidatus Hydrogenedentota bacterium]
MTTTEEGGRMKVDYDKIAPDYDKHRQANGPYMPQLVDLARKAGARDVLELGCGTGRGTQAFVEDYPCRMVALDLSRGMLEEAREKGLAGVHWVRGSATAIPLASGFFQFVFGVFFIHHVPDLAGVARECARVIGRGTAAIVTASTEFIQTHPMNRYFPSLAPMDLARFRTGEEIEAELRGAGFVRTRVGNYKAQPQPIDEAYVQKVAAKFTSTYELIPPEEFEAGLERLKADVARKGQLEEGVQWEWTLVTAKK